MMRTLLLFAIRAYQAFLSPVVPAACKFHPSCSRYAAEAIERYGVRRGARLALARLWRCRPFAAGGYDPVPDLEVAQALLPVQSAHDPGQECLGHSPGAAR